jgi:hypothetical protein
MGAAVIDQFSIREFRELVQAVKDNEASTPVLAAKITGFVLRAHAHTQIGRRISKRVHHASLASGEEC